MRSASMTLPEAKRQYKAAYELPQDIDVAKSED